MNPQILIYFNMFDRAVFNDTIVPQTKNALTITAHNRFITINSSAWDPLLFKLLAKHTPNATVKLKTFKNGRSLYKTIQG